MALYIILFLYLMMDFAWITNSFNMYNDSVIRIQKKPIAFRMIPALAAYILLILNILYILVPFTKNMTKIKRSLIFALSGLVIYGVYNATTYAIIEDYPLKVTLIDTLWGIVSHIILSIMINEYHIKN